MTISPTTKTVTYGQPYGELPTVTFNNSSPEEYYFEGWFIVEKLSDSLLKYSEQIYDETIVSITEDHTLYAKWISEPGGEMGDEV